MAPIVLRSQQGGNWALDTLPAGAGTLEGVACISPADCWAVGSPFGLDNPTRTTALHWDGSAWTRASSPFRVREGKPTVHSLSAIACSGTTACLAVGEANAGRPPHMETLVLQYAPRAPLCPDGSAPPCSTTTSTTSTTSASSSASTTTNSGTAGGVVNNINPIIDSLGASPATAIIGRDDHIALAGTAHDDNGWNSITDLTTTVRGASGTLTTTRAQGSDADGISGTFAADLPLAGLPAGNYQVDALAVDDHGAQSDVSSVAVHILPPSEVSIDYTGTALQLDFGSFDPGATLVASQNTFRVTNQLHADKQFFFDMDDFVCTHGGIPVAGHAQVLFGSTDSAGTFQEDHRVPYDQSVVDLGVLPDGATLAVKLVLDHVPVGIAGTCTTTFGIAHT